MKVKAPITAKIVKRTVYEKGFLESELHAVTAGAGANKICKASAPLASTRKTVAHAVPYQRMPRSLA